MLEDLELWALWNPTEQQLAHVRGRIVCFSTPGDAVAFGIEMLLGDGGWVGSWGEGWSAVNVRKVLWFLTRKTTHQYWLYEDGEYRDMTASQELHSCEEIDEIMAEVDEADRAEFEAHIASMFESDSDAD
jgi:hypothetical protein